MSLRLKLALALTIASCAALLAACSSTPTNTAANTPATKVRDEPIQSIVAAAITDTAKVELGRKLFEPLRLSRSGFISWIRATT